MNMTRRYDPSAYSGYIAEGSGEPSWWGLSTYTLHPGQPQPEIYFIMTGANDRVLNGSYTANETADNMIALYYLAQAAGSKPYIILEGAWTSDPDPSNPKNFTNQKNNMTKIQARISSYGIEPINGFDAYDLVPGNGEYDPSNTTTMSDVHPNILGHSLLADYVWAHVNKPLAQFTPPGPLTIYPPNGQLFNDTSTGSPTSWIWQFNEYAGNNTWITFNTSQNATFFGGIGTYGIRLNASNSVSYNISTQSTTVTVVPPSVPVASFTANITSGRIPLAVQFTDTSTNNPTSWSWTFTGNGDSAFSVLQSPVVVFSNPGVYSVNFTATNANGTTYLLRQDYINVVKYASQSVSCPNSSIIGAFTMLGLALMVVGGIIMLMTFLTSTPLMMNKNFESISVKTKDQSMYFFGGIAIIICGSILLVLGIVILSPIIGVTGC